MWNKVVTFFENIFENFSYGKVFLNVVLTFLLPIVFFSIPVTEIDPKITFKDTFVSKVSSGMLFGTSISILSTIISTYVDNAAIFKSVKSSNNDENILKKIENLTSVLPIILISFILTYLGAYFYGQLNGEKLNGVGIVVQFILYILVQIIYGITDGKIKKNQKDVSMEDSNNVKKAQESQVSGLVDSLKKNTEPQKSKNGKTI